MGGACGTCGEEKRYIQDFSGGNPREKDNLGDMVVDKRVILKWIFKKWDWKSRTGLL
jgi:hypothetical protein